MIHAGSEGMIDCGTDIVRFAVIFSPDAQCKYPRTIGALPPEQERQLYFLLLLLWAHEHVGFVAGVLQNDRKACRMSEGIRIKADGDVDAQRLLAELFAIETVANETFRCRYVAIRLDRPASHNFPSTLGVPDPVSRRTSADWRVAPSDNASKKSGCNKSRVFHSFCSGHSGRY